MRVQRIVGVLLVLGLLVGSGAAFAVAQSLKSEPPRVVSADFTRAKAFSPGCDCDAAIARFSLSLSRSADLSVRVTRRGLLVRTLLPETNRRGVVALTWDGRDESGTQVPDRTYQVQVRFARGRWRAAPNAQIRVDTTPPLVTASLPADRTIAFGAAGDDGLYRYTVTSREAASAWPAVFQVSADGTVDEVWRPAEPVALAAGKATELSWPAANRTPDRPADDGTYLVGYEVRDAAGNIVRSPAAFKPGETGTAAVVRVSGLEITPQRRVRTFDEQVRVAQQQLTDGLPGVQISSRTGPPAGVVPRSPRRAGLYGLRVSGSRTTTWGWQPVAGKAVTLVVLPTYTWQLANPYDADGDGFPDVAPNPLALDRPLGDGARVGLEELLRLAGPAMAAAGRSGAITDERVEEEGIPKAARLLLVPGMHVWSPGLRDRLRTFVARGGRVALISSPLDRRALRDGNAIAVEDGIDEARLTGVTRSSDAAVQIARRLRKAQAALAR
ncbi:MAG: hypothetical protein QOE98_2151 [Gaiellaceae bacterium]|nr:hypothetical protein [Gaiellaceae bacterium]